jgi:ribosomal protein L3 glutamine methyltransferase
VPRSFIAELLRENLSPWISEPEEITSVLDLCTGSGCLAILAADTFPSALIEAVDISPDALEVAQRNVSDYELQDQVQLIESDLFSELTGRRYDIIISNPPYVDAESVAKLPPEYLHEPELSLGSGRDGLDATRLILKHAADHLTENGILIVEIGHNREVLEEAYPDLPFTWLEVSAGDQFVFMLHRNDLL